ncbi:MAG TPA: hypothetical protein VNW29_01985 [Candidatus Sulfotelmatobacter sp.]|jgi:hypothetical protein|nr:hypothetical protein [Candidatus Sulfotelmatobacter sp.]
MKKKNNNETILGMKIYKDGFEPKKLNKKTKKNLGQDVAAKVGGTILGTAFAPFLIIFGILLFAIPIIGWIPGIFLIGMGIVAPFSGIFMDADDFKNFKGECPRCDTLITIKVKEKATTCKVCKRRLLVTKKGFELA